MFRTPRKSATKSPQNNERVIVGLSMETRYHDDPVELNRQLKYLSSFNPLQIISFLSDTSHYRTNMIPHILDMSSPEEWESRREALMSDLVLELYQKGEKWRQDSQDVFNSYHLNDAVTGKQDEAGEDEATASQDIESSSLKSGITASEISSISDGMELNEPAYWIDFDSDTRELLKLACHSHSKRYQTVLSRSGGTKFVDDDSDISFEERVDNAEAYVERTRERQDDLLILEDLDDIEFIKQNAFFKSIYLNMLVYYLNGRIMDLSEKISLMSQETTENDSQSIKVSQENSMAIKIDVYKGIVKDLSANLTIQEQKLADHNEYLKDHKLRDPFLKNRFDARNKESRIFAKEFAKFVVADSERFLESFLSRKSKKMASLSISADSDDWRHQLAIQLSAEYQCMNCAVIGKFTILDGGDVFHYPRKTGDALPFFTNKMLGHLIKTLSNASIKDGNIILTKKNNAYTIRPFITSSPNTMDPRIIELLHKLVSDIKKEWESLPNTADLFDFQQKFKDEGIVSIAEVLTFWTTINQEKIKDLIQEVKKHEFIPGVNIIPAFSEAVKRAKCVLHILIRCMHYVLPKNDGDYVKFLNQYETAHNIFTHFLKSINRDFDPPNLDRISIEKESIDCIAKYLERITLDQETLCQNDELYGINNDYSNISFMIKSTTNLLQRCRSNSEHSEDVITSSNSKINNKAIHLLPVSTNFTDESSSSSPSPSPSPKGLLGDHNMFGSSNSLNDPKSPASPVLIK